MVHCVVCKVVDILEAHLSGLCIAECCRSV